MARYIAVSFTGRQLQSCVDLSETWFIRRYYPYARWRLPVVEMKGLKVWHSGSLHNNLRIVNLF